MLCLALAIRGEISGSFARAERTGETRTLRRGAAVSESTNFDLDATDVRRVGCVDCALLTF